MVEGWRKRVGLDFYSLDATFKELVAQIKRENLPKVTSGLKHE
jgi:hypothetical protein